MRALLGSLLVLALLPAPASAYTTMKSKANPSIELKWTSLPMKFNIHQTAANGVSASATQNAVRAAYQSWSNVSCSYYSSQDMGVVNLPTGNENDYVNTNYWISSWSGDSQALGLAHTIYDPYSGKILDADTSYNNSYTWSVTGSAWAIDVQSVATHEIGHQLGLDHSQYQDATMFWATGQGDTSQRSLSSDDIAGVCYLYPTGQPPPPECTSPAHCALNETCVNGKCVFNSTKGYGSPCAADKECISNLCISYAGDTFCSQSCVSQPCPNGDQCLPVSGGDISKACLPGSASMGTKLLGEPCQTSVDCKSNICVSVPGKGYLCSQSCTYTPDNCPTGFYCAPSTLGGLCIPGTTPEPPPPPPPKAKLGEPCTSPTDCESNICAMTGDGLVCVQWCDINVAVPCPDGYVCVPAGAKYACVKDNGTSTNPPPPQRGALGAACTTGDDCQSGLCVDDGAGTMFCTQLCEPTQGCGEGFDCVPAGGDKFACTPSTLSLDEGGGGCAVTAPRDREQPATRYLVLIFVLPLLLLIRRRRR
jgi:predicted Zn-dependent protease